MKGGKISREMRQLLDTILSLEEGQSCVIHRKFDYDAQLLAQKVWNHRNKLPALRIQRARGTVTVTRIKPAA